MAARRADRPARRSQLVDAALALFGEKGVAATAVSDIVKRAGLAQGTFYLYFASKADIVNAVADRLVDAMVDETGQRVASANGAVEKLLALRDVFTAAAASGERELVETYHRPENRDVHHQMAERVAPRLASLVESVVREGIDEGVFDTSDARTAAWFVLGGLQAHELMGVPDGDVPRVLAEMTGLALRALGYAATAPEGGRHER